MVASFVISSLVGPTHWALTVNVSYISGLWSTVRVPRSTTAVAVPSRAVVTLMMPLDRAVLHVTVMGEPSTAVPM